MIKRKISRLTKLLHISAGLSLFLASQFVFSTPQQVYATPPPLVACSAEQARATERWWYFGGRGVIDFGASGTASTLSVNPQNISILEGSTVVTDTSGELQFYSDGKQFGTKTTKQCQTEADYSQRLQQHKP